MRSVDENFFVNEVDAWMLMIICTRENDVVCISYVYIFFFVVFIYIFPFHER